MKPNLLLLPMFILSLAWLSGCTTLADARNAKGRGLSKTYAVEYETVWRTIPDALTSLGLQVATVNSQEGYVLAQRGMTAFSYGENVAVFADRSGERATRVEVVSKKVMETNVVAPDWAPDILKKMDVLLAKAPSPMLVAPVVPGVNQPPAPAAVAPPALIIEGL